MKKYKTPALRVERFSNQNIITSSGWVDGLKDDEYTGQKKMVEYSLFREVVEVTL